VEILVKPPVHLNSAQAADCNPNINVQNMAQSPLSTCYSEYSNRITLKSAAIAALFVFCGKFQSGRARLSAVPIAAIDETPRSSFVLQKSFAQRPEPPVRRITTCLTVTP